MGLLDKLWDDVVAGPQPDKGLGRLRGKPRFSELNFGSEELDRMEERRRSGEFSQEQEEARRVTQSIAISKPPLLIVGDALDSEPGSTPSTPRAPRTPSSSHVGSPSVFPRAASLPCSPHWGSSTARERENVWPSVFHPASSKHTRKLGSEKFDKQAPSSPTVYDWVVLSALDR